MSLVEERMLDILRSLQDIEVHVTLAIVASNDHAHVDGGLRLDERVSALLGVLEAVGDGDATLGGDDGAGAGVLQRAGHRLHADELGVHLAVAARGLEEEAPEADQAAGGKAELEMHVAGAVAPQVNHLSEACR